MTDAWITVASSGGSTPIARRRSNGRGGEVLWIRKNILCRFGIHWPRKFVDRVEWLYGEYDDTKVCTVCGAVKIERRPPA
jgi:hypothetical protein